MKQHLRLLFLMFTIYGLTACSTDDNKKSEEPVIADSFIRAADISALPELESTGTVLYHLGEAEDMITTLKNAGCNTVRIRLWKDPSSAHSSFSEVKALTQRVKSKDMKVWITVHYSDSWADPGMQTVPAAWSSLTFADLKQAVVDYTAKIINEIDPDIVQVGNETNDGMLWPQGRLSQNEQQYLELLEVATTKIRSLSPETKIMLHYAGLSGSDWYFNKVTNIDYDYIGLSWYPIWHGKSFSELKSTIDALGARHGKKVIVAETAYPFTLQWNDWTNNIVGLESQLIPGFPATPTGQKSFLTSLKTTLKTTEWSLGFAYWGGEWVAFRGSEATNGSTWENQALYDFEHQSLPAMEAFSKD